jgi:hypothetical protein
MAGFYVPLARSPSIWTTPHVEFSTSMTFENLIMGLNDQFSLYDSINEGAFSVLGDISLLTTTANSNIVVAVNELDSDLWGAGGGNITALDWDETSIVSALNTLGSIVEIGDSSRQDHIIRDSSFEIIIGQPGDNTVMFSLISEGDLYFEAGNNITANVGNELILQHDGVDQIVFDMSDPNVNNVTSTGDYNVYSTGELGMYPTTELHMGGTPSNPSTTFDFGTSVGQVTRITSHYDTIQTTEGTLDHKVNGNIVRWKDSTGATRATLDFTNSNETSFVVEPSATFGSTDTTTLVGSSLIFKDENEDQFGAVAPIAGNNLQIQTGSTTAIDFSSSGASFTGAIRLPKTGPSKVPDEFQTELGTAYNGIHELLDALNRKVPLVYTRHGVLLNKMTL